MPSLISGNVRPNGCYTMLLVYTVHHKRINQCCIPECACLDSIHKIPSMTRHLECMTKAEKINSELESNELKCRYSNLLSIYFKIEINSRFLWVYRAICCVSPGFFTVIAIIPYLGKLLYILCKYSLARGRDVVINKESSI